MFGSGDILQFAVAGPSSWTIQTLGAKSFACHKFLIVLIDEMSSSERSCPAPLIPKRDWLPLREYELILALQMRRLACRKTDGMRK